MIMDGAVTISDIRKHARKVRSEEGSLGAIFVDYLQKLLHRICQQVRLKMTV